MIALDLNAVNPIEGAEGTTIKQIFHPHNTILGVRYSIVQCKVEPGKKSKPHRLKSSEVYVIMNGEGILHADAESCHVNKDKAVYVPPHSRQFIENTGKTTLEFLCIVDPAWRQEDEIVD